MLVTTRTLPDSHTDFVLTVGSGEFGIIVWLALLVLLAVVVIRKLFAKPRI